MRVRPLPALLVALVLAAISVPLVSPGQPTPVNAEVSSEPVEVRVALHAAEKNLNPFTAPRAQPLTHDLTMLVYDTLFWSQSRLDPEPWLATGAVASDDLRTWTVSLPDDVTWHDGERFTADDVAFSYLYFRDDGGPGRYGQHVYQHPRLETATVIDEWTVEFTFAQPVATFTALPGGDLPILPQHIWEGVADPRADETTLPIGTGPFRMVDYQPDASYRLEANTDYFLGAPLVDVLHLEVIPDDDAAYGALAAGEIDFVARNVPPELTEEIEIAEDLDIIGGTRNQAVYLAFNMGHPVLADAQVRKAMGLAIDDDILLDEIEAGAGRLGTDTWTHPNSPWTRDATGFRLSDLAAGNQLLDAGGFAAGGDGIRVGPDGSALAFTVGVNQALPRHVETAELVAEQLQELGVAVEIQPLELPAIQAARSPDDGAAPPVDLLIDELESHAHDDPDHLYFLFHSDGGGVGEAFGYTNPALDADVEAALGAPEGVRYPLINSAQDILADDLPVIALYYPAGLYAYRPGTYDGWTSDEGHGVFTKRSFLPGYAVVDDKVHSGLAVSDGDSGGGIFGGVLVPIAAVGLVGALGVLGYGLWRRKTEAEAY